LGKPQDHRRTSTKIRARQKGGEISASSNKGSRGWEKADHDWELIVRLQWNTGEFSRGIKNEEHLNSIIKKRVANIVGTRESGQCTSRLSSGAEVRKVVEKRTVAGGCQGSGRTKLLGSGPRRTVKGPGSGLGDLRGKRKKKKETSTKDLKRVRGRMGMVKRKQVS